MILRHEFPLRVTKPDDLPEPLGECYSRALKRGACRQAIFAPALNVGAAFRHQPPSGFLLMVFDDSLCVAEARKGAMVETFDLPTADVICVEIGVILLYSWLKLLFGRSDYRALTIPFNTVGIEEFRAAFGLIRRALDPTRFTAAASQPGTDELPLKFQNALRRWMSGRETLIELAFQPELRTARRGLLGLFERQIAPPLLGALTTHQFLLITEEPSRFGVGAKREGQYGHIYTYCPLSRIGALELEPHPSKPELSNLRLTLVKERARLQVNKLVSAESAPQFEWLGRRVSERTVRQTSEPAMALMTNQS